MKLQDVLNEADMQALEIDDYGFAKPKTDDDDEGGDVVPVKGTVMQGQLMKIQDSEPDDENIKEPVRTVVTDDGDELRVEWAEANAIMSILQMPMKSDKKTDIMKSIQTTKGLKAMLKFVNDKGMVK